MKQYEYKVVQIMVELRSIFRADKSPYNEKIEAELNLLGKEGWELAGVDGSWFYFKRRKLTDNTEQK